MMTIHLNGQAIEVAEGLDLHALLQQLGHAPQAFATAVNGEFVPRPAREQHRLQPGDAISCIQPIVGG